MNKIQKIMIITIIILIITLTYYTIKETKTIKKESKIKCEKICKEKNLTYKNSTNTKCTCNKINIPITNNTTYNILPQK